GPRGPGYGAPGPSAALRGTRSLEAPAPPFARSRRGAPAAHPSAPCRRRLRARSRGPRQEPVATVETARVSPSLPSLGLRVAELVVLSVGRIGDASRTGGARDTHVRYRPVRADALGPKPPQLGSHVKSHSSRISQKLQIAGHSSHRAAVGRFKHRRPERPIWQGGHSVDAKTAAPRAPPSDIDGVKYPIASLTPSMWVERTPPTCPPPAGVAAPPRPPPKPPVPPANAPPRRRSRTRSLGASGSRAPAADPRWPRGAGRAA